MVRSLREWSIAVRERDGRCIGCGATNDLHAHHIKPKSSRPELMLDLSNGVTLCYRCHMSEHEKNRPVRVRSLRPQRRIMEKRISELEHKLILCLEENSILKKRNIELVNALRILDGEYIGNKKFVKAFNKLKL